MKLCESFRGKKKLPVAMKMLVKAKFVYACLNLQNALVSNVLFSLQLILQNGSFGSFNRRKKFTEKRKCTRPKIIQKQKGIINWKIIYAVKLFQSIKKKKKLPVGSSH